MKQMECQPIRCPVCRRGRIMDAVSGTNPSKLHLYGPKQSGRAEWFVKCPKCGEQIGIVIRNN